MRRQNLLSAALTCLGCAVGMGMVACGNDAESPPVAAVVATGGIPANGTGGATGNGGSNPGSGGAATGGVTPGTGGASLGNGGSATGGSSSTGGSVATGGATNVGGSATGGKSNAGGSATGGKSNVGGSSAGGNATGGATSSGGSATGGKSAGGTMNVGGNATGGAATGGTATGGSTSTCPAISSQTCTAGDSNCFSFFVASRARMFALAQKFNGSTKGWGGDLRYGTNDGLTGADKICTEVAKAAMPSNCRTWKAFLSTSTVNAISRVGNGPWYDRLNRLIARDTTQLIALRPGGITVASILNNLPNEDGTPHHNEEPGCTDLNQCADNHDVLTGSDSDGKVCTSTTCAGFGGGMGGGFGGGTTITDYTCQGWTLGTSTAGIAPRVGHTWPTAGSFGGPDTGVQDDWISQLTESGCAPGFNLVQNSAPQANGLGTVGDGGGYGAIYCLASQ